MRNYEAVTNYEAKLAEHPWDAVGPPPPIAATYEEAQRRLDGKSVTDKIARFLEEARDATSRAEDLRSDADEEEDRAESIREEARDLIEELRETDAALADEWEAKVDG